MENKVCINNALFGNLLNLALQNCSSTTLLPYPTINNSLYLENSYNTENDSVEFFIDTSISNILDISSLKSNKNIIVSINWGDGIINNSSNIVYNHKYNIRRKYKVVIYGKIIDCDLSLNLNSYGIVNNPIIKIIKLPKNCTSINFEFLKHLVEVPTTLPITVTNLQGAFANCKRFNQSLNTWDVSKVTNMSSLFSYCYSFNQPLNNWNVGNVNDMSNMFDNCTSFNQDISIWNVRSVTNMSNMFNQCNSFNGHLNNWNVGNVTNMSNTFSGCTLFNQPLNNWNVGKVTNMYRMFMGCEKFNQPLNLWNVGNVKDMTSMLSFCLNFNQDLSNWHVGKFTKMDYMFYNSKKMKIPYWFKGLYS